MATKRIEHVRDEPVEGREELGPSILECSLS
jgi:hypothetical protein